MLHVADDVGTRHGALASESDGGFRDGESGSVQPDAAVASWLDTQIVATRWHAKHRRMLVVVDSGFITVALALAYLIRFGVPADLGGLGRMASVLLPIGFGWLLSLSAADAYEVRRVTPGPEELHRLVRAGALVAGMSVAVCFYLRQDIARGFLAMAFPFGIALLLAGRLGVRKVVRSHRLNRGWRHRILAVGTSDSVRQIAESSLRAEHEGLVIVGACVTDRGVGDEVVPGVTVVGTPDQAAECAAALGTDVVALTSGELGPASTRELSWRLEGTGCALVIAHQLTGVAGARLHVSPFDGTPMVWVDQPRFSGPARRLKRGFDVTVAVSGLLLLSPFLMMVALAVRATSPGPVLFKQSRLGLNGSEFMVLKFRTMHFDAEARRTELMDGNEGDAILFKVRCDPRITQVGSFLRRLSIDELPQLWNVIRGEMSLVGPRPLATADSTYTGHARRRLLVPPGITGLWQVSGRSDLSWDEAVQLDLYYVENWSLGLDLTVIARTVSAVLARRGAY